MTIESPEMFVTDHTSDGMCGTVEMKDSQTGNIARVHWSVTGKISSYGQAKDEAVKVLLEEREYMEQHGS